MEFKSFLFREPKKVDPVDYLNVLAQRRKSGFAPLPIGRAARNLAPIPPIVGRATKRPSSPPGPKYLLGWRVRSIG
jgi:hypothetical protein